MNKTKLFNSNYCTVFLLFFIGVINIPISAQQFSKVEILSDLEYLKKSLEDTHFNLYAYTSKKEFEQNFESIKNEVKKDSFSQLEVTKLFQKVVSKANNGHTRISFVQPYKIYVKTGGTIFPLEIAIENGKALVRKNWSINKDIQIGSELKRINGLRIEQVLEKIYPLVSAERTYFKNAQIEYLTLPRYYWLAFGEQKNYEIEIFQNGKSKVIKLNAINALDDFEMKRYDIINYERMIKFYPNAVYLNPGHFGGKLEQYKQFIDTAFVQIKAKNSKNLIIDLRNNPGGDDAFSDYLVSFIANKPFKWASRFQLKTSAHLKENTRHTKDTTKAYWKSILEHENGEIYDYNFNFNKPQAKTKLFHGKVYVLVNRQSYSQSAVTASQIQDYGFGTIVGEETAEFPNLYASVYNYKLPKTAIIVEVSKGKIERISGIDNGKGVIPDIQIKDHLLDDQDEILEGLLKRIH
ncbi:S41 family peptidase [uncultured Aquimarina sp.]|uniref:S41 family peptidase n=1 Tax=uncultured Aquimarina sp. TaxID=575652 RepID=UPI002634E7C6|nr:S41 family peptidase [uncultured Aquimarina sp.]